MFSGGEESMYCVDYVINLKMPRGGGEVRGREGRKSVKENNGSSLLLIFVKGLACNLQNCIYIHTHL